MKNVNHINCCLQTRSPFGQRVSTKNPRSDIFMNGIHECHTHPFDSCSQIMGVSPTCLLATNAAPLHRGVLGASRKPLACCLVESKAIKQNVNADGLAINPAQCGEANSRCLVRPTMRLQHCETAAGWTSRALRIVPGTPGQWEWMSFEPEASASWKPVGGREVGSSSEAVSTTI